MRSTVSYFSSNVAVASVSSTGKITANSPGETYITVSAASGVTTIVKVVVIGEVPSVDVALHAYYNSGDVEGESINIKEDGQYEVTLKAEDVGVENLNDVVSVYIKDCDADNPVVEAAQIRYDKITIDGTELTLKNSDFKSAIKSNGQFDTNDPINGWDGSAVADSEITINSSDHTVSFNRFANPQEITVTFTIQGLTFFKTSEKENEATEMTHGLDTNIIEIAEIGEKFEIPLTLAPVDTDSFVTAYSTDSSVVAVDGTALAVDENGQVIVKLIAVGEGTATITVITENGLKLFFGVGVGDVEVTEPEDPTPDGLQGEEEPGDPDLSPSPDPSPTPDGDPSPTPDGDVEPGTTTPPAGDAGATTPPADNPTGGAVTTNPVTAPVGVAENESFESGNFKYTVVKAATQTTQDGQLVGTTDGEVKVTALTEKGIKAKKLVIPASVKNGEVSYTVTSLKGGIFAKAKKAKTISLKKATSIKSLPANAFKNAKTVTTIMLNKNIKNISKSAFAGCKKLTKLEIPAKLTKVQKNAFKGCKAKIKVTGGNAKNKKANIQLLKKSGYKKFK